MELPPYRFPTAKAIGRHTWQKGKEYLKKMGGIILVASITVWALGYFPHNEELSREQQQEQSYIGRIGHAIEPVFRAQGFDWKLDVGLISGVGAKEIVASSMGILYHTEDAAEEGSEESYTNLRRQMIADGITPLTSYCFLLFVLLYFPCIATIAAIKGENRFVEMGRLCSCIYNGFSLDCFRCGLPNGSIIRSIRIMEIIFPIDDKHCKSILKTPSKGQVFT